MIDQTLVTCFVPLFSTKDVQQLNNNENKREKVRDEISTNPGTIYIKPQQANTKK
jgi:hypothetical protein